MASFGPWRREVRALLELVALTGVVFVQPTLDVLSKNATVFVSRDTTPVQAVLLVLAIAVVPPLAGWVFEVLVGLVSARARQVVHVALLAALVGVLAVEVVARNSDASRHTAVAVAVLAALVAAFVIARFDLVRQWLRVLALATPAFALLFLAFSPVTDAVFAGGVTSAANVRIRNDARVVMVVMDEFPEMSLLDGTGKVDATLFPNFAALSGDSTWYRNTTTVAGYTQIAVPAILTGDYPKQGYPVDNSVTFPHSIFTLLGGAYEMNVHESATRLCPESFCGSTEPKAGASGQGVGPLLDDAWTAWHKFAWPDRTKASISFAGSGSPSSDHALETGDEFVRSLEPGRAARLDFLHVLLPHQPWHYLPTGQNYREDAARGAPFYSWATDYVARSARQRHLLQLQAADRLLGRIIGRLKQLGVYDRSLVVVTADHGVAFQKDKSIRGVSPDTYQSVAWTPFFLKAPGQQKPVVDDQPVQSIDILPTIADHLDADIPWKLDGRSALGPRRKEGRRPFYKWALNQMQPETGSDYVQLDGREGFARALRGRASDESGDPDMRLYRDGPYGHLVGTDVRSLTVKGNGTEGSIDHLNRYAHLDRAARDAPWAYLFGSLRAPSGTPLAVAANSRLVAFAESFGIGGGPDAPFWTMLPPKLLRDGPNDIELYLVKGDPASPTLEPVSLN
jgi:hypothetical protein